MKKPLLLLLFTLMSVPAMAQKFGFLDSQSILEKMTEYQAVQREMDDLGKKWQTELDGKYAEIEKKYQEYRAKEVLLSKEDKKRMQDEIMDMEKKAKEFQSQKFGYDGELFKLREEKMKPVQDKLYDAVKAVCAERRLDVVLDRSGSTTVFFAEPRFDISEDVLRKLGVVSTPANTTTPGAGGN